MFPLKYISLQCLRLGLLLQDAAKANTLVHYNYQNNQYTNRTANLNLYSLLNVKKN